MRLGMTQQQRDALKQIARRARDARLLRRVQALLDLDAGDSPEIVAQRYQVARSTIYNWVKRCQVRGVNDKALRDLPRPGRPRAKAKPDAEDKVTQGSKVS